MCVNMYVDKKYQKLLIGIRDTSTTELDIFMGSQRIGYSFLLLKCIDGIHHWYWTIVKHFCTI